MCYQQISGSLLTRRQTLSELSKILNKENESTEDKCASSGVKYERNPAVCVIKERETKCYSFQIPRIYNRLWDSKCFPVTYKWVLTESNNTNCQFLNGVWWKLWILFHAIKQDYSRPNLAIWAKSGDFTKKTNNGRDPTLVITSW